MQQLQMVYNSEHEEVLYCHDETTGLEAIIALHDTTPGRAMGATRLWPYASKADALKDVLRLSQGMSAKAAGANIPVGGAKGVIIAHPDQKTDELLKAYARFVESLDGRFITGQDVNLTPDDVRTMHQVTDYVVGIQEYDGGPAIATAQGILLGIQAAALFRWQIGSLKDLKVAVQGLGNVGQTLCHYLYQQGVQLFVSDLEPQKTAFAQDHYQATVVPPEQITMLNVDIFSPCAMGGIIHPSMLSNFKAPIIAGCANNQLEDAYRDATLLNQRGILYCPDFVINSGGFINVYHEFIGYQSANMKAHINRIYDTLIEIFNCAKYLNISTVEATQQIIKHRQLNNYSIAKQFINQIQTSYGDRIVVEQV